MDYRIRTIIVLLAGVVLSSCSMAPKVITPDASSTVPETFNRVSDPLGFEFTDSAATSARWWRGFESETLNALVDSALAANLDIGIAAARVMEVQQAHAATRQTLFPAVQFTGDGNRQSTPTNLGATGNFSNAIPGFPDRFDITTYSASLGLGYELDFWGKARASRSIALHNLFASREEFEAVRMGVIAEVVSYFFQIQDLRLQASLATSQMDLLEERLALATDRYQRGLAPSLELYGIHQSVDETRAQLPLLDAAEFDAVTRLALLLGSTHAEIAYLIENLDETEWSQAVFGQELPSDMIRLRPDVAAAAARMEAARQLVGVRRAEQFPSFSLTAAGGTQSSTLGNLVETSQRFWLFGGSLTAPIFAAGARRANVQAAWAQYEQAALAYEKAVLTAFRDVSAALNMVQAEATRLAAARSSLAAAEDSYRVMTTRYTRGVGDYVSLVDAELNRNRALISHSNAVKTSALARLSLYRAVGGAWVN